MLLPRGFKKIGWVILIPALWLAGIAIFNDNNSTGIARIIEQLIAQGRVSPTVEAARHFTNGVEAWVNNFMIIGIIAGCLFITCSRERIEDEMIGRIRLNSLLLSLYINFLLMIIAALTVYDLDFIDVMVYNLFTLPMLFLIIYEVSIVRFKYSVKDEE